MSTIFVSHVIDDAPLMREIAEGLEAAGYTAWYFERDVLPGASYLIQITQAMECCDAIVLLVTPQAMESDQVTKEVVGAFERGIPFFPVLIDVTPPELKERQPEWRHALGGTAMFTVGPEGLSHAVARVIEGLEAMGIQPGEGRAEALTPAVSAPASPASERIAERILAARSTMEGERKQVTVLFASLTDTTPEPHRLDPEEVHDLIQPAIELMAEEVYRYEGTVAQLSGDGLTALFGAPLAHEDAPQRALYSSLAIQRRLKDYTVELEAKGVELEMRIGVNTGLVIVGRISDDLTMEYTAIGDTMNLASSMESAAGPGTILVTENTYHITEGYFDFEDSGEVEVRGKEHAVKTYRVLSARPVRTRLDASLMKGLTSFVGRQSELEHLAGRFAQAREGSGQVVGVVGEPGVGKSRLVLEFTRSLPEEEYTYLEGGCIHYGEAISYLPILEILRACFDIDEGEAEAAIKGKIEGRLAEFSGHLEEILSPLYEFLSLEVEDAEYLKLEPRQRRERVFEAIRHLLIAESRSKPLILAVEDLHWIDRTSEEFLTYFIGGLPPTNILLLLLYRPDYTPAWTSKTCYSQVMVDELKEESSADLVRSILSEGEVSSELSDFIVQRSAGNPLFIEELTRGLLEGGSIEKGDGQYILSAEASDIMIPETIQGIIASRLDRLEEDLKGVLQVAAVIGREFSYRLLEAVTGSGKVLKTYLHALQEMEFIYEKSLFPEAEYIFKHALTQEVAYESLLLKKRREIHERIGQAIEELYPDRLEDFYETLAYHYSASDNAGKAIRYFKLSGDKAVKNYSNWEAFWFYLEAMRVLDSLPETEERKRKKVELLLSIWSPMMFLNYPEGSLEILLEAERLAEELGDEKSLIRVYRRLGFYYSTRGDNVLGLEYSEKSFDMAEKIGAIDSMARNANMVCDARQVAGESLKVADTARRAIQLLEEQHREKDLFAGGFNVYTMLCGWCGAALGNLGEFEEAQIVLNKGLENSQAINDRWGVGWIEFSYFTAAIWKFPGESTIDHARKAIECFEETGIEIILGMTWSLLGLGYSMIGDYEKARDYAERGIKLQKESGVPVLLPLTYYYSAKIHLAAGELMRARECAEEALRLSQEFKARLIEEIARMILGRVLGEAEPSHIDVALELIHKGVSFTEEMELRPASAEGYQFIGELCEIVGRREEALENLSKAETMFREMGMDFSVSLIREALARLGR